MQFSIIIPTFNGADFIEQTILSALNQTRPADEIIISDDNSTDSTIDICLKYSNKITVYKNQNGPSGFVNGWNNAIKKAKYDYISILHQDDLLSPLFLEETELALRKYPEVKHLFVPCNYIDKKGEIIETPDYCNSETVIYTGKDYIKAYQTIGHPHIHRCPGVITHQDIFKHCTYRPEAGHIADDDFFYRVGMYTNIIGILKPLASYRIHGGSETGHLKDAILVKRLLHDMSFQITESTKNHLFELENIEFFKHWKNKYIKRLIGYGIKQKNISYIIYALKYLI